MIIQAFKAPISKQEILSRVSAKTMRELRLRSNGKPVCLQAYTLIHEGVSKPRVVQEDSYQKITWTRKAVESLKGLVRKGLQFFDGHAATNYESGRESIATVVADFSKEIAGKLHHIVVGHFPDTKQADKYDVCSIEAEVDVHETPAGVLASKVANLTGIALGNSRSDTPGFPGAKRLVSVQAFEPDDNTQKTEGDSKMPTFHEIKQAVQEQNIWPHQLFNEETMKDDRKFGKLFTENETLSEERSKLQADLEEARNLVKTKERETASLDATSRLESLIPEGATQVQRKFYLRTFDPAKQEDLTNEGLKKFLETQESTYQSLAKDGLIASEPADKKESDEEEGNKASDGTNEEVSTDEQLDELVQASLSQN